MGWFGYTYVSSYEEAIEALQNGEQKISTYEFDMGIGLVKYSGNEESFHEFCNVLANNTTCLDLR